MSKLFKWADSFMQPEIVKGTWLIVECGGTDTIPAEYVSIPDDVVLMLGREYGEDDFTPEQWAELKGALGDYLSSTPNSDEVTSITMRQGYGARVSAPGYCDCSDWTFFTNKREAKSHLREMYGDE